MKSIVMLLAMVLSVQCFSQTEPNRKVKTREFGIKAGFNFPDVRSVTAINSNSRTGFLAGVFFAPKSKRLFGYRSELMYSRLGYDFRSNTATGSVNFEYILLPMLSTLNITKYAQLQVGPQAILMLNAKADSTSSVSAPGPAGKLMSYYNRFDYGVAGGLKLYPFKGLLIGARYNCSFGPFNKEPGGITQVPSSITAINPKTNVFQLFMGWKF